MRCSGARPAAIEARLTTPFGDLPAFSRPRPARCILEIGFGGGEHLAMRSAEAPTSASSAAEAYVNGVAKLLALADRNHLANIRLWDKILGPDRLAALRPRSGALSLYRPGPKRRHRSAGS